LWAVRIPATILLTRMTDLGPSGLWWAMNLSNLIAGSVALVWFLRSDWQKSVITQDDEKEEDTPGSGV
jgi:Na+-driven multidrug efflux pump